MGLGGLVEHSVGGCTAGPGPLAGGYCVPDTNYGQSPDGGGAGGWVVGEFTAADLHGGPDGSRAAGSRSPARNRGVVADGPIRPGAGSHQRTDSEKIRHGGPGLLR